MRKVIICTWRIGASNLNFTLMISNWDCTTCHFFNLKTKLSTTEQIIQAAQKTPRGDAGMQLGQRWSMGSLIKEMAGLWLACEVVNHAGIKVSRMAEGFSAYRRRLCLSLPEQDRKQWQKVSHTCIPSLVKALHRINKMYVTHHKGAHWLEQIFDSNELIFSRQSDINIIYSIGQKSTCKLWPMERFINFI